MVSGRHWQRTSEPASPFEIVERYFKMRLPLDASENYPSRH
jgi:hypothetical protein